MYKNYRPEIDGLRALAVLPVILYHAGIEIFKGGFVGVDIFFVISGYLITTIILKDIEKNNFRLTYFYQRRARRILPALITVIALSLPVAIFLLPPEDLMNFSKSVISSLTFWSNFQFSSETGYFNTPGEYKPLLHTWSLSIEEQFYIFYPLFFILLFKFKKKFFNLSLILIFILSLFFAQWSGNFNRTYPFIDTNLQFYSQSAFSEFMMPFGRIWELALGAICAMTINYKNNYFSFARIKEKENFLFNIFSLVGFLLIFFSIFYLSTSHPYPSFYTLIPTLGTALIILFSRENTLIQKILSNKILVFCGLISYSAYLFHYPIFSFIKYLNVEIKIYSYFYLIPLILLISFLNWKWVEKPFRKKDASVSKLIKFIVFSYLIIIPVCFFIYSGNGLDKRQKFELPKNISNSFVFEKDGKNCFDINYIHQKQNEEKICKIGKIENKKIDFIAFGDSHLINFYPLLDVLAIKHNKKGLFLGYHGCPPLIGVYPLRPDQNEKNCYELNKLVLEIAKENNIKNLILVSRWTYYTGGDAQGDNIQYLNLKPARSSNKILSREAFEKGLDDTLKNYANQNTTIHLVEQLPFQKIDAKKIYYRSFDNNSKIFRNNLIKYSVDVKEHNQLQLFVNKIFKKIATKYSNLNLVNFDDIFCDKKIKKCLIGNENYSFYVDKGHLTVEGANLTHEKISILFRKF